MKLESLRVLHLPKGWGNHSLSQFDVHLRGLILTLALDIDTCQRRVLIFHSKNWDSSEEVLKGQEAYQFLLRWAAGLESVVVGETDVFGQIKDAWRKAQLSGLPHLLELTSWIQRLFEDTKQIRTQYLQNLGGSSYGTLVRKWIKDRSQNAILSKQPLLLVGAGQIARSVAPALLDSEILLWNRDLTRLNSFYQELLARSPQASLQKLERPQDEEMAWKKASHVIVCIPVDREADLKRLNWFTQGGVKNRSVIHLGARAGASGIWGQLPGFTSLDDLFILHASLGQVRSAHVAQAEKACVERAQLRSLGASLSIPHGWEDLACFA